jgi:hypothetical protein
MKVEQAKQIASNAIEQLKQALEAGHSERLKQYLTAMARFVYALDGSKGSIMRAAFAACATEERYLNAG